MDKNLLDETTRILTEFARTKFSAQVLDVQGPIQEGANYRWRMVSNRYEEVTVVGSTKKSLFGKPTLKGYEIYGLGDATVLKPNLKDLQNFLGKAELTAIH
jgi:hypothetical protein